LKNGPLLSDFSYISISMALANSGLVRTEAQPDLPAQAAQWDAEAWRQKVRSGPI
jgi:hypothetical protein